MLPCGTLEVRDLKQGQLLRWTTTDGDASSLWILVEELPLEFRTWNRKFKIWCVGSEGYSARQVLSVGMTTTYEFNANNVGRYTLISDV